jgi:hypothetical protein
MPQINRLNWKRIERAVAATDSVIGAIKSKPSGHYTNKNLKSELHSQFGTGRVGYQVVLDAINKLQDEGRIVFRRKAGEYYIHLSDADTVAA